MIAAHVHVYVCAFQLLALCGEHATMTSNNDQTGTHQHDTT
jgi:hypothetical protein